MSKYNISVRLIVDGIDDYYRAQEYVILENKLCNSVLNDGLLCQINGITCLKFEREENNAVSEILNELTKLNIRTSGVHAKRIDDE